ncbi:MAG: carboxypeptidase regulatory-like domain-containing protein, partial [Gemmatimonadaceae bacterium]
MKELFGRTVRRYGVLTASLFVLAVALLPRVSRAQSVTGIVRDGNSGSVIPGAVVLLRNASGARANGTISGDDGRYELTAPSSGSYSLRIDIVGFRSVNVAPFEIAGQSRVVRDVSVALERVALPVVAVTTASRCDRVVGETGEAARLWVEARKALEATRLAQIDRRFPVTLQRFERVVSLPDSVIRSTKTRTQNGVTENPFVSLDPDSIRAYGYRVLQDGQGYYYGPDAAVLLSDGFVEDHCFRTRRGVPGSNVHATDVGLAFSPTQTGRRVEIEGVLWLDSATAELRSLEFKYVPSSAAAAAGGEVQFGRLPSGMYGVRRWSIRMPILTTGGRARRPDGAMSFTKDTIATSFREEGGEVASTVTGRLGGSNTTSRVGSLRATAFDSTRMLPLGGATVTLEGVGASAITGPDGVAVLDSLMDEGTFQLRVWHPRLDSLGLGALRSSARLVRGNEVRAAVATPSVATYARRMCRYVPEGDSLRVVRGKALDGERGPPFVGAQVDLFWWERSERTGRMSAASGDAGAFTLCTSSTSPVYLTGFQDGNLAVPLQVYFTGGPLAMVALHLTHRAEVQSADSGAASQVRSERLPVGGPAAPSVIAGLVLGGYGEPVLNLKVAIDGRALPFRADSSGSFTVPNVPAGVHRVLITALGYAPATVRVLLEPATRILLYARLPRSSTALAGVTVSTAKRMQFDWTRGFEDRRKRSAGGTFLARSDIERNGSQSLADLLRNQPGVSVVSDWSGYRFYSKLSGGRIGASALAGPAGLGSRGGEQAPATSVPPGKSEECEFTFIVDGQTFSAVQGGMNFEIRSADIQAIEIYPGGASVPLQFGASNVRCGLIVIWTRS